MRRVLEMGEQRHGGRPHRLLVIESDTAEEMSMLLAQAAKKGWSIYAQGTVPDSSWHSAWLLKPSEAAAGAAAGA